MAEPKCKHHQKPRSPRAEKRLRVEGLLRASLDEVITLARVSVVRLAGQCALKVYFQHGDTTSTGSGVAPPSVGLLVIASLGEADCLTVLLQGSFIEEQWPKALRESVAETPEAGHPRKRNGKKRSCKCV